jgi:hypothetical protein
MSVVYDVRFTMYDLKAAELCLIFRKMSIRVIRACDSGDKKLFNQQIIFRPHV